MEHDPKIKMIVSAILFVMCLMILFYFIFFDPQFPVILCFSLLTFITGID
ncbi:mobilization protein, partial [Listeria monocytogenes]